ncbi:MAG: P1 family peptidase [Anaerolineaceae bacterium]|nr:P1 family peptidase [Anaerolineaceae bacterium]
MSSNTNGLTDVPGILVGQEQDLQGFTGVTVVLPPKGSIGGVDQRGGAPGTRETDALRPMHLVDQINAVVLAGGSAFGLDASSGVMKYLSEKNVGVNTGVKRVPIVSSAVIFDLAFGNADVFPDADMGYKACLSATDNLILQGNEGAGTGATIGKLFGMKQAMKSGIGTASISLSSNLVVAALVVVNAFGDVVNPDGTVVAGTRSFTLAGKHMGEGEQFANTLTSMNSFLGKNILNFAMHQNTIIGVVATNAKLSREDVNKVAQMAHNGIARSISPAHTMLDGDTIFSLATQQKKADVNLVGAYAAQMVQESILNAVLAAEPLDGLPTVNSLS